jgi:hypothetical protein
MNARYRVELNEAEREQLTALLSGDGRRITADHCFGVIIDVQGRGHSFDPLFPRVTINYNSGNR